MNAADLFYIAILGGVAIWIAEMLGLWRAWQELVENWWKRYKDANP